MDLVVPLKPREGGLGWAPELRRLPQQIVDAPPEAFVVVTSGNSAEAHRLQPWEEARKLRETIHRLQHCRLPNAI